MQLQVRLFGGLASRAAASSISVEIDDGATVGALRDVVAKQLPDLAPMLKSVKVAVNLEIADGAKALSADDEVALLPPVAGGSELWAGESWLPPVIERDGVKIVTGLQAPPLPLREAIQAVSTPQVGGTVSFLGSVRDHADGLDRVVQLDYTAYETMAAKVLADTAAALIDEHADVRGIVLIHSVGELAVGEDTILVVCAAAHRGPAFDACRDALERVKADVPVWKREHTSEGAHRWVGLPEPGHEM